MIPSLMGAGIPMIYVLALLTSAGVGWLLYGAIGIVSLLVLIAFFISKISKRTFSPFESTFEQFKISDDPDKKDEYRLGIVLSLCTVLSTGLIYFTIRAF